MQIGFASKRSAGSCFLFAALALTLFVLTDSGTGYAIPAFARKYGLPCSARHEAWPKPNRFGQTFKDTGYQLMNDRDQPTWQIPSYWSVRLRITPHLHHAGARRQGGASPPPEPARPPRRITPTT